MNCIIIKNQPTYKTGLYVNEDEIELLSLKKSDFEELVELKNAKIADVYKFLTKCLNRNKNGLTFTDEEVGEQIDFFTAKRIITEYTAFHSDIQRDPN